MRIFFGFAVCMVLSLSSIERSAAQESNSTPPTSAAESAAPSAGAAAPERRRYDKRNLCITDDDAISELQNKRRQIGGRLVVGSSLLPMGSTVDIGIDEPFTGNDVYFAAIDTGQGAPIILDRPQLRAHQAGDTDTLVKKRLLARDRTIVSIDFPDVLSAPWRQSQLYLFTCQNGSPLKVSDAGVIISPALYSAVVAWAVVVASFFLAGLAFRSDHPRNVLAYFDPIAMTAGPDGKASLGKLQVLLFSLIVFGLITYFLLKTGALSDISSTVLLLMGIAGIGSTVAKGADNSRTTLSPDSRAYLLRKGWLPSARHTIVNEAHWRDLLTTDGEFDVYRYQSLIFSLVVAAALIIGGITQLSSFEIPQALLGILGLSQIVYIGGKLVTPTTMADLNKAIGDMRNLEQKVRVAAVAANNNAIPVVLDPTASPGLQSAFDAYLAQAADVATLFTEQTSVAVPPERIQPTL
ncbi:hypothetical protein BSZ19_19835 [Bradyrhizobium japonicum]|uniref:Uncharacterized protein n=1 Tax=Bradyrhizobium japonicum TaxID=375 RepID=A0A1Y2JMP4_BRAJP|nr:hypothetical protein [Bradyrhizobium japonicum]OSJ32097.1 hypothetical protein BSZ19_19835 [Bradyrhizobium japonicum]